MKFEEVLPALREGKKLRLKEWEENQYIYKPKNETELRAEDYHVVNLSWKDFLVMIGKLSKNQRKLNLEI